MGQIVLAQRVVVEMGANQPETTERMRADPKLCQRLESGCAAVSYEHLFDDPAASDQETDGTTYLSCQLAGRARQFGREQGGGRHTPSIQPL